MTEPTTPLYQLAETDVECRVNAPAGGAPNLIRKTRAVAPRWTMNGWDGDDECPGFLDRENATLDDAKQWAEQTIARTSDYRVIGWHGTAPQLQHLKHRLEIWTADGSPDTYPVKDGQTVRGMLRALYDDSDVLCFPEGDYETVYIPVRAITTLIHRIERTDVELTTA